LDHPLSNWLADVADELLIEYRKTSLLHHNPSKAGCAKTCSAVGTDK